MLCVVATPAPAATPTPTCFVSPISWPWYGVDTWLPISARGAGARLHRRACQPCLGRAATPADML